MMSRHDKRTLANGLRVVCIPQPHLHACEVSCYVGVGSRHEPDGQAGISHFLEHMLFRGTDEHPDSLDLEKGFEALGGGANAATDAETTCYFSRFHPDRVGDGLALFASMLQRPRLADIEIERRIILEEAQEDFNEQGREINPDSLMARLLWPGSSLARPTIGSPKTLAAIDEEMLRAHHRCFYTPANTVIAVAGKVDTEAVFAAAERHFGAWRGRQPEPYVPDAAGRPVSFRRSEWVEDSASQLAVQLALPLPGRRSEHGLRLRILRRILSGGVASRLMLRLREKLGLTYSIEANLTMLEEAGALVVDFMVVPENLPAAVREVCRVFAELCRQPVPDEEFRRIVDNYLFDLDFSLDHPDEMVVRYGWGELVGDVRDLDADRTALQSVTPADLSETLRACFDLRQLRLVVVGPFRPADRHAVEAELETFAAGF